jgi:hypothetical protein
MAVAVALLSTAACGPAETTPLEADPSFDHRPGTSVTLPFQGWIDGQLSFVPPFEPGSLEVCNANFSGDPAHPGPSVSAFDQADGAFSVIGRIRLRSRFCFDPESPESSGTGVLTAVNGHKIFIGFTNTAGLPGPDGIVPVHGTQWVTGGTGRFARASGEQTCQFTVNAVTFRIRGSCEGSIRLDHTPDR